MNNHKQYIMAIIKADANCLPSHWTYNPKLIYKSFPKYPVTENNFKNNYHENKKLNDNTHYGDQFLDTLEFLIKNNPEQTYATFYKEKMTKYQGYLDSATRETLKRSQNSNELIGSDSDEIGGICRALPLLILKQTTMYDFVEFSKQTHNSSIAIHSAILIYEIITQKLSNIDQIIKFVNLFADDFKQLFIPRLQLVKRAINEEETIEIIKEIGQSCHAIDAVPLIVYLLNRYETEDKVLKANFYAGGDNAARAMIIAAYFNF